MSRIESRTIQTLESLQPVFIVGTGISGTTFLNALFDSHPSVLSLHESRVYRLANVDIDEPPITGTNGLLPADRDYRSNFAVILRTTLQRDQVNAERLLDITGNSAVNFEGFLEAVEDIASLYKTGSMPKILLYALLTAAQDGAKQQPSAQPTHFVEKTPNHYEWVDKILEDFPNARFIHMLRDPRDNYLGLKRRIDDQELIPQGWLRDRIIPRFRHATNHPAFFTETYILKSLDAAYENVARFGGQYRVLFYEDLIYGGEEMVRVLASWLGLSWNENMVNPTMHGAAWKGNSRSSDLIKQLEPFDTRPIGRWKAELSIREIGLMEDIIDCYNLQTKYPTGSNRTQVKLALRLVPPFPHELRIEAQWIAKDVVRKGVKHLLRFMGRGVRDYWRRRYAIYSHIVRRSRSSDDRIIQNSFVI